MFGFLTSVRHETADPLADVAAADAFWRALPRDDPIAAQMALCAALADPDPRSSPDMERLRALLALDRRARALLDALLANGGGGESAVALARSAVAAGGLRALPVVRPGPHAVPGSMREGARSPGSK